MRRISRNTTRLFSSSASAPSSSGPNSDQKAILLSSLTQIGKQLENGSLSSRSIVEACLSQARQCAPYNAYISMANETTVLKEAEEADARIQSGQRRSIFDGIPISVKDIFATAGMRTTCGSNILNDFVPPYDATVVDRLKKAGAIIIGKTNMDEFGMGSATKNSHFGPTINPWSPISRSKLANLSSQQQSVSLPDALSPGGSSGGSAASLAARTCFASIGTDTGGSVRQPAALCGLVGFKPTYGRSSRYGMISYASSLDTAGVFAHSVEDAAALSDIITGHDPLDPTSLRMGPTSASNALKNRSNSMDLTGVRIGIPQEYFLQDLPSDVAQLWQKSADYLRSCGAELVSVSLPHTKHALAAYYVIAPSEVSSNLARYDGVRYGITSTDARSLQDLYTKVRGVGFGLEARRRILAGTFAMSSEAYEALFMQAQQVRRLVADDFTAVFSSSSSSQQAAVDALLVPVTTSAAESLSALQSQDPVLAYMGDVFTIPASLAGLPSISVPSGFSPSSGLPLGMQLIGQPLQEESLLSIADTLHQMSIKDSEQQQHPSNVFE